MSVVARKLDLTNLPPIYVSDSQYDTAELHDLEDQLVGAGAPLTYDIQEASVIISKATKRARIQFDLRSQGLWTTAVEPEDVPQRGQSVSPARHVVKRRKLAATRHSGADASQPIVLDDSSTESDAEPDQIAHRDSQLQVGSSEALSEPSRPPSPTHDAPSKLVTVVKPDWFAQCKAAGRRLDLHEFASYYGYRTERPRPESNFTPVHPSSSPKTPDHQKDLINRSNTGIAILERARQDASETPSPSNDRFGRRGFGQASSSPASNAPWTAGSKQSYPHLLHRTTTEEEIGYASEVPEMPDWVKAGVKYACQRSTPKDPPNAEFISLLKKIRLARTLTNDEIGVRAYSTSIAALAAYPYKLSSPKEILALPGCEGKIANLFVEWSNTGQLQAVELVENDPDLKTLRMFYEIWGVGALTAREFYFDRGWRDLDDIVEFGWKALTRVQQIGVKFYDEFLDPIPRSEVESIGRIIHEHAVKVRDDGIQSLIVGGYRRGKEACGDVDILVSHPDEDQTANIINDIVGSLEDDGWITHTLTLSMNNTKRDQQTLPFKSSSLHGGASFDSLDKALVVWQDPHWPSEDADLATDPSSKNPNIHRRVDIIIAPWRTVGCAVVGWSGATTFERDLRRYAKNVKGWKFDSSGVRDRGHGEVIDVEGYYSWKGKVGLDIRAKTMLEAEKRVFEGFGIEYREPWERCTE